MKDKEIKLEVSEKNMTLRIVGFIIAVLVAVGGITSGIMAMMHKDEGWYEVDREDDGKVMMYRTGVTLTYHFTGESDAIRAAQKELTALYSDALRRAYRLLDASEEHEGYNNIAYLNAHPGEEVRVSTELFSVLTDALERTGRGEGYSLFSGPINAEWTRILYSGEQETFDPAVNSEEAEYLAALRERLFADGAVELRLDGAASTARLDISPDLAAFLEENDAAGVLDLGLLHDAYMLRLVADALEAQGWKAGYFITDSGLVLNLSESDAGDIILHGFRDGRVTEEETVEGGRSVAMSGFRSFRYYEDEGGYYEIAGRRRSPFVPSDGEFRGLILASYALNGEGDIVGAAYENAVLASVSDAARLRELESDSVRIYYD